MSLQQQVDEVQASSMTDADKAKVSHLLRTVVRKSDSMDGGELRNARLLAGLSVGQAAGLIGVPRETIERWENSTDWPIACVMSPIVDRAYGLGVKE